MRELMVHHKGKHEYQAEAKQNLMQHLVDSYKNEQQHLRIQEIMIEKMTEKGLEKKDHNMEQVLKMMEYMEKLIEEVKLP
jgi:hypothetical protein